jgi:uncharacterized protein
MAGLIVWHELFTDDVEAATRFYTELLGAEIETATMEGGFQYQMLNQQARSHAGIVPKPAEDSEAPNHWYPYVWVDDVDASVEQAKGQGAQVYHGPTDIPDMLRFAVLGDPQHATFGVMTGDGSHPTGLFVWDEIHSPDAGASEAFYSGLFGWTAEEMMEGYKIFSAGETQVGGLMQNQDGGPPGAYWLTYLAVDDVDASTEKALGLGATQMMEPTDIPNIGRFSIISDPTGAAVGLYKSAN